MPLSVSEIQQKIIAEARRQGVDPALALGIAQAESSFNPNSVGDRGKAIGLFQLQPAAASDVGLRPEERYDVDKNIAGGIAYLRNRQRREGDEDRGISAYNQGIGMRGGQLSNPQYVRTVRQYQQELQPVVARSSPSLLKRVMGAVQPSRAEAATLSDLPDLPDRPASQGQTQEALPDLPDRPAPAPGPAAETFPPLAEQEAAAQQQALSGVSPREAYDVEVQSGPPGTFGGREAVPPPPPTAATQVDLLRSQEQQRLAAERAVGSPTRPAPTGTELAKGAAATGISTGGSLLGTGAGLLAAPFTGPFAPAMPWLGEMLGSYGARKLNVALGLEDPGVVGDVASVALPGLFGLPKVVRGLRAAVPAATPLQKAAERVPTRAVERVAAAGEAKVPLTYGEAVDAPMAKRAETLLEQVPLVGTGGFRQRQQAAVKAAGEAQVAAQRQAMQQTPWHGLPQVQAAAQQGSKQAQRVLDDIAQAGDDWTKITQASGNLKAFRARQVAGTLYDNVGALAEPLGNVPITKTVAVIDDTLKELRRAVVPDTETIRYLDQLKSGLQSQTQTTVSPLVDASGNAITKAVTLPGKTTYGQLRTLRSDLGDTISDYYRGSNAVVGAKGVGSLAKVKGALEQDLDTFALQSPSPELRAAAKQADRFYKQTVVPYEDTQLAKALTSDTPDEIYGKFIQRGHRDRAEKFYNALDPRGKAAVQYGMVAEAQQKALDPTTGVFSPAKFEGSLKAIQDARGVFFKGEEAWKLDGLMKTMRAAERAGQYAENPPTGARVIPLLLGGAGLSYLTSPGTAAAALAGAKGLSWLLTSRQGTRLLLAAHRAGEQTVAMETVLRELTTQGARVLATEVGEGLQEGTQVQVAPGRVGR